MVPQEGHFQLGICSFRSGRYRAIRHDEQTMVRIFSGAVADANVASTVDWIVFIGLPLLGEPWRVAPRRARSSRSGETPLGGDSQRRGTEGSAARKRDVATLDTTPPYVHSNAFLAASAADSRPILVAATISLGPRKVPRATASLDRTRNAYTVQPIHFRPSRGPVPTM